MKKYILALAAAAAVASPAFAFQKAIYVKQGDQITRYNFGVAEDLHFSNGGKTLTITGYGETINLDNVDYISFSAPVDDSALTPSSQKQKLVEIGEAVNEMIDLNDNPELIRMEYVFFSHYHDNQGDYHHPASEFEVPQEYWDVHNEFRSIVRAAAQMVKGNPAAARTLKAKAINLYKVQDYFGIYTANEEGQVWVRTATADYFEFRFNDLDGKPFRVHLEASEGYTTWDTKDFRSQWPNTIDITFYKEDKALATTTIKTTLVQDKKIDMTVHFDANGYVVDNALIIDNESIYDQATSTIKGKYLLSATSNVYGKNLLDYDAMKDDITEASHYHDEDGNCCGEDPTALLAHFYRASSDVDLINQLQIKGKGLGFTKLYDALNEDDYYYRVAYNDKYQMYTNGKVLKHSGNNLTLTYDDLSVLENKCRYLANYIDAPFYYDGKSQLQGYLGWEVMEDSYESYWGTGGDPVTYGYTIYNDFLVYVHRDIISSTWTDNGYIYELGPWFFDIYDNDSSDSLQVTVDDNDVIFPEVVTYKEYEIQPLMIFPDLTSIAIEDFFDENSFSKLIDDYDEIVGIYETITGQDNRD